MTRRRQAVVLGLVIIVAIGTATSYVRSAATPVRSVQPGTTPSARFPFALTRAEQALTIRRNRP